MVMKKISFTTVTWYSQIVAIVLFVGVFFLGFHIGGEYASVSGNTASIAPSATAVSAAKLINNVTFLCPGPSTFIAAQFMNNPSGTGYVDLELSDGRTFSLPQVISADGARYADPTGSFVFWNKGNGAFIEENGTTTYSACVTK